MTSGFLQLEIDRDKLKKYGTTFRDFQRHMRDALWAMAEHWHANMLERHFEESAYERYGYYKRKGMDREGIRERAVRRLQERERLSKNPQPITSEAIDRAAEVVFNRTYTARKKQQFKHNRPLSFTGAGMLESLAAPKIRGSSKQVRVVLPSKFNFKNPDSRISMRDELTRIIPSEATELVDVGRKAFRDSIARSR